MYTRMFSSDTESEALAVTMVGSIRVLMDYLKT